MPDGDDAGERFAESFLRQVSPHRFARWVKPTGTISRQTARRSTKDMLHDVKRKRPREVAFFTRGGFSSVLNPQALPNVSERVLVTSSKVVVQHCFKSAA